MKAKSLSEEGMSAAAVPAFSKARAVRGMRMKRATQMAAVRLKRAASFSFRVLKPCEGGRDGGREGGRVSISGCASVFSQIR